MRMPTDPTKFKGLRPPAAHALAEIIDNVDEGADPAALIGNCHFEIELANAIAWQIDEGLGDADELQTLGLPVTLAKSIAEAINESRAYPSGRTGQVRAEGQEMIVTSRRSWRDSPIAKAIAATIVTIECRLNRGARLRASIYAVKRRRRGNDGILSAVDG